jgi:predicted acylesterase/phospholipase RssA
MFTRLLLEKFSALSLGQARPSRLAALLFKATGVANRKRATDLAASADVLFKPPVQDFDLLSVDHFDEVAKAGYHHAKQVIETARELT